jgi:hypothetical protein
MRPPTPKHSGQSFDVDSTSSSTPRMSDVAFDFNTVETAGTSCMGLSLSSVMRTFRTRSSAISPPAAPHSYDNIFHHFNTFRSTVQKTLMCAMNDTYPTSPKCSGLVGDDPRIAYDSNTFRQDMSLAHRIVSWGTHDTATASGQSPLPSNHQVKFHNPPVTSVRLRSRTRTKDIDQLFFSPEELDEIKDDRYDTMMTDDIETLAVGEVYDWCDITAGTSSSSSVYSASDCDDQDSRSGLMLAETVASNVMFDRVGSPRKRDSPSERKFVRGVQIMLREKSADRNF